MDSGTIEKARQPDSAGTLVCPMAKDGGELRTAVRADALAATKKLRGERLGTARLNGSIRQACKALKLTPFKAGTARHSVATWAIEVGADQNAVATFLNHRSPATTRRFYATLAVPAIPAGV